MDAPIGADTVLPEPARLGALRLTWLKLRHRGRLRVGAGVLLGRDAQVRIARGARVELGDGCYLGDGCRVEAVAGTLAIGPRALIGARAFVVSHAGVTLGADCVIGDFAAVGELGAPGACRPGGRRRGRACRRPRDGRLGRRRGGRERRRVLPRTGVRTGRLTFAAANGESRTHACLGPSRLHARRRR